MADISVTSIYNNISVLTDIMNGEFEHNTDDVLVNLCKHSDHTGFSNAYNFLNYLNNMLLPFPGNIEKSIDSLNFIWVNRLGSTLVVQLNSTNIMRYTYKIGRHSDSSLIKIDGVF